MSGDHDIQAEIAERDGELPAHLDPDNPDNKGSGEGLVRDDLFGPDSLDVEADADPELDPEQALPGEEEEEPEPEPEADPDDEVEEPEPEPEEDEPKPKGWDKQRQKHDQEMADLRKQVAALTAKLEAAPDEEAATKVDDEDPFEELPVPEADEFDDPATIEQERRRVLQHNRMVKALKATQDQVAKLQSDTREEKVQAANKGAFEAILTECDKRYGREFRNAAVAEVRKLWKSEGYGPGAYPSPESTRAAVKGVYATLKAEAVIGGPKKKGVTGSGKTAVAGKLKGTGKSIITAGGLTTTNEDAFAQVRAELGLG